MASTDPKTEANDAVPNTAEPEGVDGSEKTMSESDTGTKPAVQNRETKKTNALQQKLNSTKRALSDRLIESFHGDPTTRLYHVWPGNNVFFCGGRLVCGPDPRGLVLTTMAIAMSSWSFAAYVADGSGPKIICSLMLTFIVLVNLGMVSMTNPGIVPRSDKSLLEATSGRRVDVGGVEMRLKYCRICDIYRPLRSRHCTICDNCVEKFDHHCPWTGQCIGLRNYRLYVAFLFMALIFFAYIFAFSFRKIMHTMARNDDGSIGVLSSCPEALALASFVLAAAMVLAALTCYNLYLVALNQTAYENSHRYYASTRNPYDRGVLSNLMEVFCWSTPPSRVDFRAEVMRNQDPCSPWMICDQLS